MKTIIYSFNIKYKVGVNGLPTDIKISALNRCQAITKAAIEIAMAYGSEILKEVIFL